MWFNGRPCPLGSTVSLSQMKEHARIQTSGGSESMGLPLKDGTGIPMDYGPIVSWVSQMTYLGVQNPSRSLLRARERKDSLHPIPLTPRESNRRNTPYLDPFVANTVIPHIPQRRVITVQQGPRSGSPPVHACPETPPKGVIPGFRDLLRPQIPGPRPLRTPDPWHLRSISGNISCSRSLPTRVSRYSRCRYKLKG